MIAETEAARALGEIEAARDKAAAFKRYRTAAPHFTMWGVIWFIGNGAIQIVPHYANYVWAALIVCAIVGASVLGAQARSRIGDDPASLAKWRKSDRRIGASLGVIWAFIIATAFLFGPPSYREMNAFISMCAGFAYMAFGVWVGWRLFAAGVAVAGLTLIGFFLIQDYFALWMAIVGGGALLAAGLWLRRA